MPLLAAAAPTGAQKTLAAISATLTRPASATVKFTSKINGQTTSGTLTMAGKRFTLALGAVTIWYDGKTQWVYSRNSNEVMVSEPTADELAESNPLLLMSAAPSAYFITQDKASAGQEKVTLKARSKFAPVKWASVTAAAKTHSPTLLVFEADGAGVSTIKVGSIKTGTKLPDSFFRFNKKAHPSAKIIDLR